MDRGGCVKALLTVDSAGEVMNGGAAPGEGSWETDLGGAETERVNLGG